VGIGPMAVAIDPAASLVYVSATEHLVDGKNLTHTVSIIDMKTNKVTGKIDVGAGPFDIKIVGDKIFTSNSGEWQLAMISKKDRKVIKKVKTIDTPLGMAVTADGGKLYLAIHGKGSVSIYNTADLGEIKTVKVGKSAWYIDIDHSKNKAYVTRSEDNAVAVIDTKTDKVIGDIKVGKGPRGVAVDSDAGRAYVVNHLSVSVSIIDTSSDRVIGEIKLSPATDSTYSGSPWGIAIN